MHASISSTLGIIASSLLMHTCFISQAMARGNTDESKVPKYTLPALLQAKDGDPTLRPYQAGVKLWEQGFYVRWGADTLQFGPPFHTTEVEMQRLFDAVGSVLDVLD